MNAVITHTSQSTTAIHAQQIQVETTNTQFHDIVVAISKSLDETKRIQSYTQNITDYVANMNQFILDLKNSTETAHQFSSQINNAIQEEVTVTEKIKNMTEALGSLIQDMSS